MTEDYRNDKVIRVNFQYKQPESATFPGIFVPDSIILDTATAYVKEEPPLSHFVHDLHQRNLLSPGAEALTHYLLATVFPLPKHPVSTATRLTTATLVDLHGFNTVARNELLAWITMPRERKQILGKLNPAVLAKRCFIPAFFAAMENGMWEILICCLSACRLEAESKLR